MALQHKVFKAQVWAIAKVVTFASSFFVSTRVLNQSKGHTLTTIMTLTMNMEVELL